MRRFPQPSTPPADAPSHTSYSQMHPHFLILSQPPGRGSALSLFPVKGSRAPSFPQSFSSPRIFWKNKQTTAKEICYQALPLASVTPGRQVTAGDFSLPVNTGSGFG